MRCPNCGARNPDEAAWCSQCLTELRPAPDVVPDPEVVPDAEVPASDPLVEPPESGRPAAWTTAADADETGDFLEAGGGRFRRHDGEIEWCCVVCQSWNVVGLARCTVCGAGMDGPEERVVDERATPGVVLLLTVLLPGAGHAALGLMATAWARGLTYLLWLLGGAALVVTALSTGESPFPGLILLLGAITLWTITVLDVRSLLAQRTHQILEARVFLWLVVGVIGLLLMTFMATFTRVGGGSG